MAPPRSKVAFLGLGAMGSPIARRLKAAKFDVFVWNRHTETAKQHSEKWGTTVVRDFSELKNMDYVMSCLPNTKLSGEILGQVRSSIGDSAPTFFDLTSGDVCDARSIADTLSPSRYIDSPISGGPKGAHEGTLTTMAGVSAADLSDTDRSVLEAFCKKIVCCGDVGSGFAVKSTNNYLNVTHLILASDALLRLKKAGVDPEVAADAINASSGRSLQTEVRIPTEVFSRKFNYGFRLDLMAKDVACSESFLGESEFFQLTNKAMSRHQDSSTLDYTEIVKDLEQQLGTTLKSEDK